MLKNKNLAFQIWVMFVSLMSIILLLIGLIFHFVLGAYFSDDIYKRMEESQTQFLSFAQANPDLHHDRHGAPNNGGEHISHVLVDINSKENSIFPPFLNQEKIFSQIKNQKAEEKQYTDTEDGKTIYYLIRHVEDSNYLVTFASPGMKGELTDDLFNRLMIFVIALFIMSFPFSIFLAKRLTRPLTEIEKHVNQLASRKWDTPLLLNRKDEVGKLSLSIEKLRKRLVKHDEKQQSFMQHMSHELKTPVMIIQSYMQAIEDGIYPKGDLQSSVKIIQTEVERLNKRIQSLLYLTKLNYLEVEKLTVEPFQLQNVLYEVVDKFSIQRKDVDWNVDLEDVIFNGDKEQFQTLFENLIQNQIRYTEKNIEIRLKKIEGSVSIVIENDGEKIKLENPELLFEPFYKGEKGQFGLGLAIVKNIVTLHHGTIQAENKEKGVKFTIIFPIENKK